MDESKWLSSDQVLNLIKDDKKSKSIQKNLNYKDDLNFCSLSLNEKNIFIEKKLEKHFDLISMKNAKRDQQLGKIEWIESENKSVFTKLKNKPQYMGESKNNKIYLNNEESLFLIEIGSVVCYYNSLQLSYQDAFELMLKSKKDIQSYSIYSYLTKFGFILKKYSSFKEDYKEKKLKENSSNSKKRNFDLELENNYLEKRKKNFFEDKKQNKLEVICLKDVIKDKIFKIDNYDVNFLKFSRLINLNFDDQTYSWQELEKKYDENNKKETIKQSLLIDGLNDVKGLIENKSLFENKEKFKEFYDDFLLEEDCLIKFDENLTEKEIEQRLLENGPQNDIYNCFLNNTDVKSFEFDYVIYLPNKSSFAKKNEPDYYLKLLSENKKKIPIEEMLKLNSKIIDQSKILYTFCDSNDFNFYQVTNIDLQI